MTLHLAFPLMRLDLNLYFYDVPYHLHNPESGRPIIDILSIGSLSRADYQLAQQHIFQNNTRYFFPMDERVDIETTCNDELDFQAVTAVVNFCRRGRKLKRYPYLYKKAQTFISLYQFNQKANPVGWLCAQKRFIDAFSSVINFYRKSSNLPDYLFIVDDDTYLNLTAIKPVLEQYPAENSAAIAGCLLKSDVRVINFTYPFGGHGTIFTKRALQDWMRPIQCPSEACVQVQKNRFGERKVFRPGMSVADLMFSYAHHQPYVHYRNWTLGFCLHSDWAFGYFTNEYITALSAYRGSFIDRGETPEKRHGECANQYPHCKRGLHTCHYIPPDRMRQLYDNS